MKLLERVRNGARLTRRYEPARTPLDRLAGLHTPRTMPEAVRALLALRDGMDPFDLAEDIEAQLDAIERIRNGQHPIPRRTAARRPAPPPPPLRGSRAALETSHAR